MRYKHDDLKLDAQIQTSMLEDCRIPHQRHRERATSHIQVIHPPYLFQLLPLENVVC